jgi:mono/diheme cytochrome c family protein
MRLLPSALILIALPGAAGVRALDITLPPETAAYRESPLPGYQLVRQNCLICHSAQYVQYQPPTSPRAYWEATVVKMKKTFGAPFADEDTQPMVDYLVKTYGAERAGPSR